MAKQFGLDARIVECANNASENHSTHNTICAQLMKLSRDFNLRDASGHFIKGGFIHKKSKDGTMRTIPYSIPQLVYFAISKEAHKDKVFNKGYTKIDVDKAKAIFKMLKFFAEYNGNRELAKDGNLAHALTKYYEKKSKKFSDFKADVETYWKPYPFPPKRMKEVTIGLRVDIE